VDGVADAGREEEPHPSWLGVQRKVGLEVGDESWRDVDQVERWQRSKGSRRLSAGCGGPRKRRSRASGWLQPRNGWAGGGATCASWTRSTEPSGCRLTRPSLRDPQAVHARPVAPRAELMVISPLAHATHLRGAGRYAGHRRRWRQSSLRVALDHLRDVVRNGGEVVHLGALIPQRHLG
jgi:hypothetical protein